MQWLIEEGNEIMILADKIIKLRKKNGWTQEELAEKVNVSRQSVSKWEGAQSVPDLDKILQLSQIFGVSTDYLLKDEMEEEFVAEASALLQEGDGEVKVRRVTMEEANDFLRIKQVTGKRTALATVMCILSPICMILLSTAAETGRLTMTEEGSSGFGLIVMILVVAAAVAIFISCGMQTEPYAYLEKEAIETEYGVSGMVRERKKAYRDTYVKYNILGTIFCILSPLPLFGVSFLTEDEFYATVALSVLLVLVAVGTALFIVSGTYQTSMQKLLQEGDYTIEEKKSTRNSGAIGEIYWLIVLAIYLGYSFYTKDWKLSWIIWPVAGILFAALMTFCGLLEKRKAKNR